MADEIVYSNLVTNGGRAAELIGPAWHQVLYDATDLSSLVVWDMPNPSGSNSVETTKIPAPPTAAAVSSESSGGISNTAFTTSAVNITTACQMAQITATDLMQLTAGVAGGKIDIQTMVRWLANCRGLRITDMLCALFASLSTNSVGSGAGDTMTIDHFYSAMYKLNSSLVPGAGIALVLAPKNVNELVESIRGEGGAAQYRADIVEMLGAKGPGYKGNLLGIDIFQSDSVNSSGGAYKGAMFGYGTFKGRIDNISALVGSMIDPNDVIMNLGDMIIERKRDFDNNTSTFGAKFYAGIGELEDARGCLVNVDA